MGGIPFNSYSLCLSSRHLFSHFSKIENMNSRSQMSFSSDHSMSTLMKAEECEHLVASLEALNSCWGLVKTGMITADFLDLHTSGLTPASRSKKFQRYWDLIRD